MRLQGGGEKELAAWRSICEISRREFEDIYRRLGVTLARARAPIHLTGSLCTPLHTTPHQSSFLLCCFALAVLRCLDFAFAGRGES